MKKISDRIDSVTDCSHWLSIPTPLPKSVKIETISKCNYKCNFCATQFNMRNMGEMDYNLFKKIVTELSELGIEEIGLFYLGEPFLCKWISDAIKFCKDSGIKYVFITTNGSCITESNMKKCIENGLDSIKFSLNFSDKDQFEEITKVDGRFFDKIIETIKMTKRLVVESNSNCGIYASCIRYNDDQVKRMENILSILSNDIDEFYWLPLYDQAGNFSDRTVVGNVGRHDKQRSGIPCWSIFSSAHITYDGLLTACCFDHKNEFTMGDLKEKSFVECWNSDDFKKLRKCHIEGDISNTNCKNCLLS